MLQFSNDTPFEATLTVFPDADGVDTLYGIVKATFTLGQKLEPAAEQVPLIQSDEYHADPESSSLRQVSEFHLKKPGTDVVMIGTAQARDRKRTTQLDVRLSVGRLTKTVRVFGDRNWKRGLLSTGFTSPQPFQTMPLTYEAAYGGSEIDIKDGGLLVETRNPVGKGFVVRRKGSVLDGFPLPNLEDPSDLISKPDQRPAPAGFGFIAPTWEPRKSFAGTYDEEWERSRAPFLPADFDSRFFNAAHPDLCMSGFLRGGEPVIIENASPEGRLSFSLPRIELDLAVTIAGRREPMTLDLETVLIEPDQRRLGLVWRGSVPCDKQVLKVERAGLQLRLLELGRMT